MRRTIFVLLGAAVLAGCQPPADEPASPPPGVELAAPELPAEPPVAEPPSVADRLAAVRPEPAVRAR